MLRQEPIIPCRDLTQPVIGNHERAKLLRRKVIEAQGRHFGFAEQKAGEIPAVSGDDVAVAVDEDWER